MSSSSTTVNNLKINRGTYANIQANLSSIGENELVITTDKAVPIPTTNDSGKVVKVNSSGEYELGTVSSGMTNPMTTQGDIIYGGSSGTPTRLAKGTAGQVLTMNSGATAPTWASPDTYSLTFSSHTMFIQTNGAQTITTSPGDILIFQGYKIDTDQGVGGINIDCHIFYNTTTQKWYAQAISNDANGSSVETDYVTVYYIKISIVTS